MTLLRSMCMILGLMFLSIEAIGAMTPSSVQNSISVSTSSSTATLSTESSSSSNNATASLYGAADNGFRRKREKLQKEPQKVWRKKIKQTNQDGEAKESKISIADSKEPIIKESKEIDIYGYYASNALYDEMSNVLVASNRKERDETIKKLAAYYYNKYGKQLKSIVNIVGQNVLHLAALHGSEDVAKVALLAGIDINLPDKFDGTALITAVRQKHFNFLLFLEAYKPNVNLQDSIGYTALHHAVELKDYNVVYWLLRNKANPNIKSYEIGIFNCATPMEIAKELELTKIIRLIEAMGRAKKSYT